MFNSLKFSWLTVSPEREETFHPPPHPDVCGAVVPPRVQDSPAHGSVVVTATCATTPLSQTTIKTKHEGSQSQCASVSDACTRLHIPLLSVAAQFLMGESANAATEKKDCEISTRGACLFKTIVIIRKNLILIIITIVIISKNDNYDHK